MSIEEKDLITFVRMAELGSLQKVAERLRISVPTASRCLKKLNHELGIVLFEAKGRSLELTDAGKAFLPRARESLSVWAEIRNFPSSFESHARQPLRLIAFTRYALPLLVPALVNLLPQLSDFRVKVDMHNNRDFTTSQHMHPFDFGVGCVSPLAAADLTLQPIGNSPLVACVPANSKWKSRRRVSQKELMGEKFVCLPSDTLIGSVVHSALPFLSPSNVLIETTNSIVAVNLVAQSVGIHITDCLAAEPFIASGCHIVQIEDSKASLPISCFWPKDCQIDHTVIEKFLREIKRIFDLKTQPFVA